MVHVGFDPGQAFITPFVLIVLEVESASEGLEEADGRGRGGD